MRFLSVVFLLAFLPACALTGSAGSTGRPVVVTSTTVMADLIRNVVGDRAEVVSLVPVGGNPFDYEPSPKDVQTVSQATAFIANGLTYETFLRKLLENAKAESLPVVYLSDGLDQLHSSIDHGDHGHRYPNPYLYLNVRHAIAYVEKIRDAMVRVDAPNAATYRANAEKYLAELAELDAWIVAEVARLPEGKRRLMKDHDSFIYYAFRYGFVNLAASYEGTREAAPSPSQYATLINQIRHYQVTVLFGEVGFGSKLLQQLAVDTGARFVPGLHAATLGTTEETNSYVKLMRWNTRLIVENIQG